MSLPNQEKRGRPDIAHFNLLQLLGSPLNREGLLAVYVHTIGDLLISINPKTRIPRNYDRFVGLMEQLLNEERVPPKGEILMELKRMSFPEICDMLKLGYLVGLSTSGDSSTSEIIASRLAAEDKPGVVIGGFPKGHFSPEVERCFNEMVSIDREALDSWIVASRIAYDYERALGIPEKRR
jgi:rRNA small subunit pseudouridine methyltransferase Nep1